MATRFVEVDVRQLEGLAENLGRIDARALLGSSVKVVNQVAEHNEPKLRESIVETINLTNAYLQRRMTLTQATLSKPVATISAPFKSTTLGRYNPQLKLQRAVSDPKRLKGNPHLGIPVGMKPMRLNVEVVRGQRKPMTNETAFLSPKQRDSDGNMMIFTRLTAGKYPVRARYGPAVYQLFRVARDRHYDEIASELELSLLAETENLINEAFQ